MIADFRTPLFLVLTLFNAAPSVADDFGRSADAGVSLWRVVGALVFCLFIAVGAAFALRRRLGGALPRLRGPERRLRLVETLRLSHQVDLCLVDVSGREIVLVASAQGVVLLTDTGKQPQ